MPHPGYCMPFDVGMFGFQIIAELGRRFADVCYVSDHGILNHFISFNENSSKSISATYFSILPMAVWKSMSKTNVSLHIVHKGSAS
jgi:hypothetical protein